MESLDLVGRHSRSLRFLRLPRDSSCHQSQRPYEVANLDTFYRHPGASLHRLRSSEVRRGRHGCAQVSSSITCHRSLYTLTVPKQIIEAAHRRGRSRPTAIFKPAKTDAAGSVKRARGGDQRIWSETLRRGLRQGSCSRAVIPVSCHAELIQKSPLLLVLTCNVAVADARSFCQCAAV